MAVLIIFPVILQTLINLIICLLEERRLRVFTRSSGEIITNYNKYLTYSEKNLKKQFML